jgi:hypothetical protein
VTVLENGCIMHIDELQKKCLGGCVQDTEAFQQHWLNLYFR